MNRDPALVNVPKIGADVTSTGTQTLTNKTLTSPTITTPTITSPTINSPTISSGTVSNSVISGIVETWTIVQSAATGTINLDILTSSGWYYTSNASANHTLNLRGNSSTTFASRVPTSAFNESWTVVWANTNGATAYYPNVFQIDGNTVTPRWQGGTAPTAGNANSIDIYTYTVMKLKNSVVMLSGFGTLTSSGTTATVTHYTNHGFATGDVVSIVGATPTGYNGTYTITVTSTTQFTYTLASTQTSPAGYNPFISIVPYRVFASQTRFA